jgi:hypothetical protein
MGLQQELYSSRFTASPVQGRSEWSTTSLSSQPSYSPLSSQPSQFHLCEETVINDDLLDYHESEAPLASLCHYLPHLRARLGILLLSAMTKMILTICLAAQVIMRRNQCLLHRRYSYFIVEIVAISATSTLIALSTSVIIASCMLLTIANPTVQTVEAGDFNLSGGQCYECYFSSFLLL